MQASVAVERITLTLADHRAVVRLDAPDRGDEVTIDAVGLLDLIEGRLMLRKDRAAVRDAVVVDQDVEIVPERFCELGLRIEQIHDPQVGREVSDLGVEHRARDAAALGLRPQPREAAAEIGGGGADRVRRHQRVIGRAGFPAPFRRGCRRRRRRGRRVGGRAR